MLTKYALRNGGQGDRRGVETEHEKVVCEEIRVLRKKRKRKKIRRKRREMKCKDDMVDSYR